MMRTREPRDYLETQRLASSWDNQWEQSAREDRLTLLGRRMFSAKEKVLRRVLRDLSVRNAVEVGCGSGHTLAVLAEMGYDCVGIDASPHAVAICGRKGLQALHRTLEDFDETFDLVSSDGMLEHFLHFEPYARHMMRISRKYVLLIQPNHGSVCGKTLAFLAELLSKNVFEYNYRVEDFIEVFDRGGFEVIRNIPVFFDVFRCLVFVKRSLS